MLIIHTETTTEVSNYTGVFLKDKSNEQYWLNNDYCLRLLSGIDNVTRLQSGVYSNITGLSVKSEDFSGGVKALIDLYMTDYGQLSQWLGNNCIPYMLEIASAKDVHLQINSVFKLPNRKDRVWDNLIVKFKEEVAIGLDARRLIREAIEEFSFNLKNVIPQIDNINYDIAIQSDIDISKNQVKDIFETNKLHLTSDEDYTNYITNQMKLNQIPKRVHTVLELTEKNRKYIIDFDGKLLVLTGDSAIGKSYIVKLTADILAGDFIPGLTRSINCTNNVSIINTAQSIQYPFTSENTLYLIDESMLDKIPEGMLYNLLNTKNRFILITRDLKKIPTLPEQCINTLTTVKDNEVLHTYNTPIFSDSEVINKLDLVIVEDKLSGKAIIENIIHKYNKSVKIKTSDGNTKLLNVISTQIECGYKHIAIVYDRFNASIVRYLLETFIYNLNNSNTDQDNTVEIIFTPWNSAEESILRFYGYPVSLQVLNGEINNLEKYSEFKLNYLKPKLGLNYSKGDTSEKEWWSVELLPEVLQKYCKLYNTGNGSQQASNFINQESTHFFNNN